MKKINFIVSIVTFLSVIAVETGFLNALFMFLLLGIIPGTEIVVPANVMLLMICTVICAILFYSTGREILHLMLSRHTSLQKPATKAHLPKQRFSEI
jgi:hypothetical protein